MGQTINNCTRPGQTGTDAGFISQMPAVQASLFLNQSKIRASRNSMFVNVTTATA
jgi:hypothetical protein